ncbi:hypothetical protein [Streptomyces fumanus]|uniref:hypothetical protein n=1 Tax=Streptomyces fumanus TaxID=67302 RepID=UPI00340A1783
MTGLVHGSVSAALGALAAEGATGALTGGCGVFHLTAGRIAHVESAPAPGVGVLLAHGAAAAAPATWGAPADRDGAGRPGGRRAVEGLAGVRRPSARGPVDDGDGAGRPDARGSVDGQCGAQRARGPAGGGRPVAGALEICHLGALFDAAYFALAGDGPAGRFRPGAAHPLGVVRPVPVETVLRESRRRRDLLERIWPDAAVDLAPLARVPDAPDARLPPRRARVLGQVDGVRTAVDIAASLACRTYHTLVELRRLAADGLVTAARLPAPPAPGPCDTAWDDPDTALLRRVRAALEAL